MRIRAAKSVGAVTSCALISMVAVAACSNSAAVDSPAIGTPSPTHVVGEHPTEEQLVAVAPKPKAVTRANGKLRRYFSIKTRKPVFFITIDDGGFKDQAALNFVRKEKIPVNAFLTNSVSEDNWKYFRNITAFGGSIQNHTMDHKSLTSGSTDLRYEICDTQKRYGKLFGTAPTMLRPPYGNGGYPFDSKARKSEIDRVAASCGIEHVVMWNATVDNSGSVFLSRGGLSRGDIVLLHFTPGLGNQLKSLMKKARSRGLSPVALTDYLK